MEDQTLVDYEKFLRGFTKRSSHKRIGERTIEGILIMSKFIVDSKSNESLEILQKRYSDYLKEKNHSIAKYALWLYLKHLGYNEKFVKEIVSFHKRPGTALNDEEMLAASVLSKRELIYLVENISDLRDKLIIKLLYDTGARVSEICSLCLKDLDINSREIQLMGKGRKPRTVYFHQSTGELIRSYLQLNNLINPNLPLFTISRMSVWRNLKEYGRKILSKELHPHMLRHSRLQHMADEGGDSFAIKSFAGHSDIGTTQAYIRSSKYQGKIAFDKAGDIWK